MGLQHIIQKEKKQIRGELQNNSSVGYQLSSSSFAHSIPSLVMDKKRIEKDSKKIKGRSAVAKQEINIVPLKKNIKGLRLGPLTPLLLDEAVSEIMVNAPNQVYCVHQGKLMLTSVQFRDNDHVMSIIEQIAVQLGQKINESSPIIDARLPDGSRVSVIIPPLAINGPSITISKFITDRYKIEDLIHIGTITEEIALILEASVKAGLNMMISGGTGVGKSTTLNVLSNFIPCEKRITVIEDVVTSGEKALEFFQLMNTEKGYLATGHSTNPEELIARLETMVHLAEFGIPVKAIREQISGGIDIIIQQSRLKDGTRKITNISEVQGMEGGNVVLQDIFTFKEEVQSTYGKMVGGLVPTGVQPKLYERLAASGVPIPASFGWEIK